MKKRLQTEWTPDLPEQREDHLIKKALRQKMDADYREKWRQQLADQGIERKKEAKLVGMTSRRRFLSIAAAIAVFLVAGWWIVFQNSGTDAQQLADLYLQETAGQVAQVQMGDASEEEALWQEGREFYTKKQFAEAIRTLENLAAQKSLSVEQAFLLGMAYAQTIPPDFDQALIQLTAAEQMNTAARTDTYREEIEWTKALLFYKKGEKEKAKTAFEKIIEADGWYAEKAKKING
ncbi:MAG: hypothetical protein AAFZ15_18695 [Bacteroidota bacterium]